MKKIFTAALLALAVIGFLGNPALAAPATKPAPERSVIATIWDFVQGGGWVGLCDRIYGEGTGVKWRHTWTDATPTRWSSFDACPAPRKQPREANG